MVTIALNGASVSEGQNHFRRCGSTGIFNQSVIKCLSLRQLLPELSGWETQINRSNSSVKQMICVSSSGLLAAYILIHPSVGRLSAQGASSSKAAEARSTVASSCHRPMICRPTGRPALEKPHGTFAAGSPVMLTG
jgi:hypothetical protein